MIPVDKNKLPPSYVSASAAYGARFIHGPLTDFHPLADAAPAVHIMNNVDQTLLQLHKDSNEFNPTLFHDGVVQLNQQTWKMSVAKFSGLRDHEATGKMMRKIDKRRAGEVKTPDEDILQLIRQHYKPESTNYLGFFKCSAVLSDIKKRRDAICMVVNLLSSKLKGEEVRSVIRGENDNIELDDVQKQYYDETKRIIINEGEDVRTALVESSPITNHVDDLSKEFHKVLDKSLVLFKQRRVIYDSVSEMDLDDSIHKSRVKSIASPNILQKESFKTFVQCNVPPLRDNLFASSIHSRRFVTELLGMPTVVREGAYDNYAVTKRTFISEHSIMMNIAQEIKKHEFFNFCRTRSEIQEHVQKHFPDANADRLIEFMIENKVVFLNQKKMRRDRKWHDPGTLLCRTSGKR